jgi:hypothetical protein
MYSVGQVLYFILAKKSQVYPMQVVEVITKRTLGGEDVSYVLQAGPEKETKVMFDQVDGEVFESPEVLRQTLIHRATIQVNKLIDNSMSKAETWYSDKKLPQKLPQTIHGLPELLSKNQAQKTPDNDEDESVVTMPDGSVVRVKLPSIVRESM